MQQMFIGVDGGGTKCRMRLADADLNTLGESVSERPSNLQVRNGDAAYEAITELSHDVLKSAGLTMADTAGISACFGLAGARLPEARMSFQARQFPFANVLVDDDIDIARAGAHGEADGGVMIVGTGSAAMALVKGERYQIGGWGFHVGDQMSGAAFGRELLRRSLMAHDGLFPTSPLSKAVMAKFDNSGDRMMAWSFDNPDARKALLATLDDGQVPTHSVPARPGDYGQFSKMITDFHAQGDPLAAELVAFELNSIQTYVDWFKAHSVQSVAVVGGLGRSLLPQIQDRFGPIIIDKEPDPVHGALILARQHFSA